MELFGKLGDFLLEYGPRALDAMARLDGELAEPLHQLVRDGLLAYRGGRFSLTPKAVGELERQALADMLSRLKAARPRSDHLANSWSSGDAVSEAEMIAALGQVLASSPAGCPMGSDPVDAARYLAECRDSISVALLLDMSYSMSRFGRFFQAKKVALAFKALVREYFPNDSVDVIGFYSQAERIEDHRLPLMLPKPVSVMDKRVSVKVPLAHADLVPQHFTNLQMGLKLAGETLAGRTGRSRHAFVVLDGEPTAFTEGGQLVLRYPPDGQTASATLAEAKALAQAGIRLTTFALIDDYYYMDWVGFVDRMTRLARGVSFYCGSDDLAGCVLESYLSGKKRAACPQAVSGG